ncbi:hypothetical protein JOD64_005653 [Micromonospora luteifusca]|uniref:Uncharacterized protein n=1 Tax=Micromonospora luteifusca TaxID=709860 RepID=A0ABS2M1X8_9ACTN|nr:hypothetical protein [Micromonospora luteifusca]MBM7494431.1 hypothetical protein [Micromonospora luteifusca]
MADIFGSARSKAGADIGWRGVQAVGHGWGVIVIQRVRVRWSAAGRGAPEANARRGLNKAVILPAPLPTGEVLVHDVLADEAANYARRDDLLTGDVNIARGLTLWLTLDGPAVTVERLPGRAAFPRAEMSTRLFTLSPGQVGRYRANFRLRFTDCACNPNWYYEDWVVHVSNGDVAPDRFLSGELDREVDNRVHLYGGSGRRSNR